MMASDHQSPGPRAAPVAALAVAALAIVMLGTTGQAWALSPRPAVGAETTVLAQANPAGDEQPGEPAVPDRPAGLTDATKQGIGCLVTSGATVGFATFMAGATESLMIAAGGLLVPSTAPTLWLGLFSTMAAATCGLGAIATPAVLWAVEQRDNIAANLAWGLRHTGAEAAMPAGSGPHQLADRTP